LDQLDPDLLFVLYRNMVDYNCHKWYHCHFFSEVDMGMHHNRVQMHSLVVVLPGRNLGTFVEHCLSQ
jgi:hypothetical protein